jgi:hypothetical protein
MQSLLPDSAENGALLHVSILDSPSSVLRFLQSALCTWLGFPLRGAKELTYTRRISGSLEHFHLLRDTFSEPIHKLISSSVVLAEEEIRHAHVVAIVLHRPVDIDVGFLAFE